MWAKAVCLLAVLESVKCSVSSTESYTHKVTLSQDNVVLFWKFTRDVITFEIHALTTGWIGVGFSPSGSMAAADIVVGWVKNGRTTVTDRHGASRNAFPPNDDEQNIEGVSGKEDDGWTMIKFSRQLASCGKDDREITSSTQRLIWAYEDKDPKGIDITPDDYHGASKRGSKRMYLLDPPEMLKSELPEGPDYTTFDIVPFGNVTIPAKDTFYNCRMVRLPDVQKKNHIVKFEPLIQKGNELYVHHMVLYRCADLVEKPSELDVDYDCYDYTRFKHSLTCLSPITAWAIGGGSILLPDDAGFSIGTSDDPVIFKLETHYDNPGKKPGIVDRSGLRMTYTTALRQHDAGVFEVGNIIMGAQHFIPPGAKNFLNVGFCAADCLQNAMDRASVTNVTLFSVLLHTHLAGRAMKLRHFRNGAELPYISYDETYDFSFQEERYLNPRIRLESHDILRLDCVYNTEGRTTIIEQGGGTFDEMCLAFISYYPKTDLSFCQTAPEMKELWNTFGISKEDLEPVLGLRLADYNVTVPGSSEIKTAKEALSEYDWTEKMIEELSEDYLAVEQQTLCASGTVFNNSRITTPTFDTAYKPPKRKCVSSTPPSPLETTTNGSAYLSKHFGLPTFVLVLIFHSY